MAPKYAEAGDPGAASGSRASPRPHPVDEPEGAAVVSTVRTVVHPGWIAVSGPDVDAVVAAADRHAPALELAARDGLVALLEALTAHGLSAAPDLVACAPTATGLRVVVRGAGVVVLPDGTRVGSGGRMPWADLDLEVAAGGEVVLEAPEPEEPRGWRRPARLSRPADERAEIDQLVTAGTPGDVPGVEGRAGIDQLVTAGTPGDVPGVEGRTGIDQLVTAGTSESDVRARSGARTAARPDPAAARRRRRPAPGGAGAGHATASRWADRLRAVAARRRRRGTIRRRGTAGPSPRRSSSR